MTYIVCIDDEGGMMLRHRRLSRDRVMLARLLEKLCGTPLYATAYSAKLFAEGQVTLTGAPTDRHEEGALFLEECDPAPLLRKGDRLLVYHWGRSYPSDLTCTVPLDTLTLVSHTEFAGSSHPDMVEEEYLV